MKTLTMLLLLAFLANCGDAPPPAVPADLCPAGSVSYTSACDDPGLVQCWRAVQTGAYTLAYACQVEVAGGALARCDSLCIHTH